MGVFVGSVILVVLTLIAMFVITFPMFGTIGNVLKNKFEEAKRKLEE